MADSAYDHSPEASHLSTRFLIDPEQDDDHLSEPHFSDGDTASAKSIALSSPPRSPRDSTALGVAEHEEPAVTPVTFVRQSLSLAGLSKRDTVGTDASSEVDLEGDSDDRSFFARKYEEGESPLSSVAPSVYEAEKVISSPPPLPPSLPPSATLSSRPPSAGIRMKSDTESILSTGSASTSYSKKARPESLLVQAPQGALVLGIALVDFNHLVGPKIEFSRGDIFEDEELAKILPFLALPDGAHLTTEDYSYFHLVPSSPNPSTIFGISCNRQISTAELLYKDADVTRSTVQKAVVVLASKPVFGPIRDRLGVITRALFAQRNFSDMSILDDFYSSLEHSLRGQLTESGLYMGTSLRELVHNFRQRTLVLVKALMLQKKIMFFGHPVERLCTYQYSLVTLIPGLLQNLDDCGSPPLASRAQSLSRPTSLKTSDPKSMMAYMGLPLDLFGKDSFFQPYLPLQQLDMLKDTGCWLCGSTNSIVTQQKEIELLVNIETGAIEFRDPKLERLVGLTPADRKWMDDIVKDVNDGWNEDPDMSVGMHFKGSDDYLRQKFEEYINAALSSVKYSAFLAKGQNNGIMIQDGSGDPNSIQDFNPLWIQEFKKSHAYEVWERVTDPLLFDLIEAREKPSVVADIGLRLAEGIQELKLEQQLAPTREAISRTLNAGSTNFFNAVAGVRERWISRAPSATSSNGSEAASDITKVNSRSSDGTQSRKNSSEHTRKATMDVPTTPTSTRGLRPLSIVGAQALSPPEPPRTNSGSWGSGISSFFSQRTSRLSTSSVSARPPSVSRGPSPAPPPVPPMPMDKDVPPVPHAQKDMPPLPSTEIHEEPASIVHEEAHVDHAKPVADDAVSVKTKASDDASAFGMAM
ncbi:Late secretory pathway protein AVL9 [Trametes pubescens]|uniref:Late secretory pathway protein AVL9 n=1 Tax=Trametes pubescens TaxID=154538 RepID=A0A1M2VRK3_TRAPU|nr:Late secretory pathway protein AVL9 [Trametes pubescens]